MGLYGKLLLLVEGLKFCVSGCEIGVRVGVLRFCVIFVDDEEFLVKFLC